jgi:hypothetical protein
MELKMGRHRFVPKISPKERAEKNELGGTGMPTGLKLWNTR